MDITCRKCGQQYRIPDQEVEDRRVYFNCQGCGEKIVIDRTREGKKTPEPLTSGTKELLSAIPLSFSRQRVLISFTALFMMACVILLAALFFLRQGAFLLTHPAAAILVAGLVLILCLCLNDCQGYFVSRSALLSMDADGQTPPAKSVLKGEAPGLNLILLFTVTIPLVTLVMFMPVRTLRPEYIFHYTGILLPFTSVILFVFFIYRFFRELIIGRLARPDVNALGKGWLAITTLVRRENINLVAYNAFINLIMAALSIPVLLCAVLAVSLPLAIAVVMSGGNVIPALLSFMPGLNMNPAAVGAGTVIVLLGSSILLLAVASWLMVLRQAVATVAVQSMEKNPGKSLSAAAVLAGCLLMALPFLIILFL